MGACLVGEHVREEAATNHLREYLGNVPDQTYGTGLAGAGVRRNAPQGVIKIVGDLVEVACLQPSLHPCGIDLDSQECRPGQLCRQRLSATHAAEAGGDYGLAGKRILRRAEVLPAARRERFVGPLEHPLGPDVDP